MPSEVAISSIVILLIPCAEKAAEAKPVETPAPQKAAKAKAAEVDVEPKAASTKVEKNTKAKTTAKE